MTSLILATVIGLFVGFGWGWIFAHNTIATECEKLGAFYVGTTVYTCVSKKELK